MPGHDADGHFAAAETVEEVDVVTPVVPPKKTVAVTPGHKQPLVTAQYGVGQKTTSTTAQPIKKQEEYVAPDVKEGDVVKHKTFGNGTVTWFDKAGKHIRVKFAAGEKTFIFPDAFKMGFLSI